MGLNLKQNDSYLITRVAGFFVALMVVVSAISGAAYELEDERRGTFEDPERIVVGDKTDDSHAKSQPDHLTPPLDLLDCEWAVPPQQFEALAPFQREFLRFETRLHFAPKTSPPT